MNMHLDRKDSARAQPSREDIVHFLEALPDMADVGKVQVLCAEFLARIPHDKLLEVCSAVSHAHPFFLPQVDDATAENLKIGMNQLAELVMRGRLTASRAKKCDILVACAPKSASTFIANALKVGLGSRLASLACPTASALSSSMLGANLRSQELDELALLRNGLDPRNYVAQHHVRCTPYLARQLALYGVKPIVTIRNFFDSLVSLDDMLVSWRKVYEQVQTRFFNDGLPAYYSDMPQDERLDLLVDAHAVWYVQFLLSWQKCETFGLVKPLWISYENDFLGDKQQLAAKIATFIGSDFVDPQKLADALADKRDGTSLRLNKGIAGRGEAVSAAVRQRALAIFNRYDRDGDLAPLIGVA
ncbi:hypothetical protein H4S14_002978 [Agrobacterium vitis]|nr:hypothetical protein [Agrobacterium vitis]MBE1439216.1 hypothetical protein [Agrobacterium vitis]